MFPLLVLVLLVQTVVAPAVGNGTAVLPIPNPIALASSAIIDTADVSAGTCKDIDSCRTLVNIVWSCLVTIFACIWVAIHRNIPGPQQRWISIQLEWLKIVILALLVPEWILAWGVRQFLMARRLAKKLEVARLGHIPKGPDVEQAQTSSGTSKEPADAAPTGEDEQNELVPILPKIGAAENGEDERPVNISTMETNLGRTKRPWTITHAFFVIMGGFHYYNDGEPLYPLSPEHVLALVRNGELVPPTEDELKDKSKRDALSKSFVILQTLWFVVQCIARRIEHLPTTELEIMTLAYTVITVAMYGFWWYKPLNVACPVRVWGKDKARGVPQPRDWDSERVSRLIVGGQDDEVNLEEEKQVPTFYSGRDGKYYDEDGDITLHADVIALSVAMVFGAVHCVAWSNAFPSHVENLLWRISGLAIVAIPVAIGLAIVFAFILDSLSDRLGDIIGFSVSIACAPLYIAARIVLLVLSFTTLRSLPLAAYQTVQWTTFIPHI